MGVYDVLLLLPGVDSDPDLEKDTSLLPTTMPRMKIVWVKPNRTPQVERNVPLQWTQLRPPGSMAFCSGRFFYIPSVNRPLILMMRDISQFGTFRIHLATLEAGDFRTRREQVFNRRNSLLDRLLNDCSVVQMDPHILQERAAITGVKDIHQPLFILSDGKLATEEQIFTSGGDDDNHNNSFLSLEWNSYPSKNPDYSRCEVGLHCSDQRGILYQFNKSGDNLSQLKITYIYEGETRIYLTTHWIPPSKVTENQINFYLSDCSLLHVVVDADSTPRRPGFHMQIFILDLYLAKLQCTRSVRLSLLTDCRATNPKSVVVSDLWEPLQNIPRHMQVRVPQKHIHLREWSSVKEPSFFAEDKINTLGLFRVDFAYSIEETRWIPTQVTGSQWREPLLLTRVKWEDIQSKLERQLACCHYSAVGNQSRKSTVPVHILPVFHTSLSTDTTETQMPPPRGGERRSRVLATRKRTEPR